MANTLKTVRYNQLQLWQDRPVVVLLENDGRETYFHGVAIGPEGMSYKDALKAIDDAFRTTVATEDEDSGWTYDDVHENIREMGFEIVSAADWWEDKV